MISAQDKSPLNQILVENLVKKYYTRPVLNHLSITIGVGDFCILVGANGAGKTTLLRILAGLVRPDSGQVHIGDPLEPGAPQIRRMLGYVSHQPMFYQDLTALENLQHYARLYRLQQADDRVTKALQSAGLTRYQHQALRTYSRGMGQRLTIARALLHDPQILLFDEPYTGLDKEAAHFLDQQLKDLHQEGKTILMAAHRPHRLLNIATHLAWLKDGRIPIHIPIEDIEKHPGLFAYIEESA